VLFGHEVTPNADALARKPQAGERLMASPAGYLWDACSRKHLSFRTYDEMASFISSPDSGPR
jgi:hypothetical protein